MDTWKSAKASSPKLEFYNQIKHDFEFDPETYLGVVKIPDARKSLTRFRITISCHNLYIERGRYEIREKCNFYPKNITDLTGLLSNKTLKSRPYKIYCHSMQEQSIQFPL